jgi:hypothetical protein
MKRIAWILIAVFCPLLVRVQPVETLQCAPCACCHCKLPGDCGMPCGRAYAPAPIMFAATQSARVTKDAARNNELPARLAEGRFYAPYVASAAVSVAFIVPTPIATPAGVPLFKAHCSFLI